MTGRARAGALAAGALLVLVALTAGASALVVDAPLLLRVLLLAGSAWGLGLGTSACRAARQA